jgi:hypothetical protein
MPPGIEEFLGELVLGPRLDRAGLLALCERHALSPVDTEALLHQSERLGVYRELVRGNLREAIELSMPRSIARLGSTFDEYFDRFLVEQGPRTHYLRDVTRELLSFCAPLWARDERVPGYVHDLALHESLHIEVSALPAPRRPSELQPLSLERGVELSSALRLVHYGHAVHELPAAEADRTPATAREVSLLVYRSPEHEVRYLELTPLACGLVERLISGENLGTALTAAAAAEGASLTENVLSGAAQLLADLAERGVVQGAGGPHTG